MPVCEVFALYRFSWTEMIGILQAKDKNKLSFILSKFVKSESRFLFGDVLCLFLVGCAEKGEL